MFRLIGRHRLFLIIVTLLTPLVTYPMIVYVFNTDVLWHPGVFQHDIFIKFWDVWYGKLFLTGEADRFYTDLMFYPRGLSLALHPFFLPHIIIVNALSLVLPVSNAFNLAHLLIVWLSALSAYVYLHWLMKDKLIALFGAIVFGFSPHVVGHPYHPDIAAMATAPLTLYFFHRGVREGRGALVIAAGLLTGLTTVISMYLFICILILLGFFLLAFSISQWRERRFWLCVLLLGLSIVVSSLWRVYPLASSSASLGAAVAWHGSDEIRSDVLSFFINHGNPLYGRHFDSMSQESARPHISTTSYLGFLPLLLILAGLLSSATRRRMLPWAFLCALFLILRLGSHPTVLDTTYADIRLPKYYLDQLMPFVFEAFWEVDNFMMGALMPFAVLACFGLVALRKRFPVAAKPGFTLALALIVAVEYYSPPVGDIIDDQQLAFLGWLAEEGESDQIRLINLPMGRNSSKVYNFYQSIGGYPQVEGAISRTPESAYDYIRSNYLLNAWRNGRPIRCDMAALDDYIAGLAQLEKDGFSHVVYDSNRQRRFAALQSFQGLEASFSDKFVSVYRLSDLRGTCPEAPGASQRFIWIIADILKHNSLLRERGGALVTFPPTPAAGDQLMRFVRHFTPNDRTIVSIAGDADGSIRIQSSDAPDPGASIGLDRYSALWLANTPLEFDAEQSQAYQGWFLDRFKYCSRFFEDDQSAIDLYLKIDVPCSAIEESSAVAIRYDDGLLLHNVSFDVDSARARFYLSWAKDRSKTYGFSIQLFDAAGAKALQIDSVILDGLLSVYTADTSQMPEGEYGAKLIVYDFETRKSQGGTMTETGLRFERELEIGRFELRR